jgi:RimJ/RimL family protein N-acetyltransferase
MLGWMRDPRVSRNLGLRRAPTLARTRQWIRQALKGKAAAFGIEMSGEHIGNVVLDKKDDFLRTARLSVYIGEPSARGQGAGRRAVTLVARHGFGKMGLNKIWLTVYPENCPAVRLYRRAGFRPEGTLRDEFRLNGKFMPVLYMGLLRRDFRRLKTVR